MLEGPTGLEPENALVEGAGADNVGDRVGGEDNGLDGDYGGANPTLSPRADSRMSGETFVVAASDRLGLRHDFAA